jgi:hypothetical protein
MTLQLQGNSQAQGPQASQTWISLPMQLSNRTLLKVTVKKHFLIGPHQEKSFQVYALSVISASLESKANGREIAYCF